MPLNLQFHHTGLAVDSIEDSLDYYRKLFGSEKISKTYSISSQHVSVCFVEVGPNVFLELIEAKGDDSSIHRMRKKGVSYYHVAYLTKTIEETVSKLVELNFKPMEYFNSEAFDNKRCIFLFSPEAELIELIESE
ncbi:MAG: VOC family protein [Bacteroidetes bacterium]|nr:VOC family protein [Bacteroidota bacterium]